MRKHIQWIVVLLLILNLAPDILALATELLTTENARINTGRYFNIFSLTGLLSFLYVAVAFFLLFHHYFSRDKRIVFIIKFILVLVSYICVRYLLEEVLMPATIGLRNYGEGTTLKYYFFDNVLYGLFYGGIGIVYYFIQRANASEKEKQAILLAKQQAELSFLRSQINPHFLFNSLNNIYALVYHKNEQSLAAIQKLSALLRYILYAKDEQVPVQKELEYIQNYVDLELMRYDKPGIVDMQTRIHQNLNIAPMLLLPFVENAFKHGNLQSPQPVSINCSTNDHSLQFSVKNTKASKQKDALGGVGLSNIRRRLELLYPNRHSLNIQDHPQHFTINLQIAL
jgi:two-component system, LytTR family, sensor kinase